MTASHFANAKANLDDCSFVGLFERFPADAMALSKECGFKPAPAVLALNVSGKSLTVDRDLRRRLEVRNALDAELFDHGRRLALAARHDPGSASPRVGAR